eukprot:GHVT01084072.1.p2 GENE.GHVT01084072.1~~GHVT01084072.1.p2  ORF type:complete len:236 (+),score=36.06 GHVT01084072.1:2036-2743(+)
MREVFLAFDSSKEGTIRLHELASVMKTNMEISNDEIEHIFQSMDSSGDEEIYYTDFLAAMLQTRIKLHEDLVRRSFQKFDVDKTGWISLENLKAVLGDNYRGDSIESVLKEADISGNGQIHYEEFLAIVLGEDTASKTNALPQIASSPSALEVADAQTIDHIMDEHPGKYPKAAGVLGLLVDRTAIDASRINVVRIKRPSIIAEMAHSSAQETHAVPPITKFTSLPPGSKLLRPQ